MNVLVTGGAGFIGSHLVRHLLAEGDKVTVIDNLSTGLKENLPIAEGLTFIEADVDSDVMEDTVLKGNFNAIVHLAAQTMVNISIDDPLNDTKLNIMNTVRLLESARRAKVSRIVFASSAAVYGNVSEADLPVRESRNLDPLSFYGLSKMTVEKYLDMYHKCFGLEYVVLRFANVYGERQGDGGEGGVISIFAKRIANGDNITIFGDGEQTRDFVYAGDIADGIIAALSTSQTNVIYNLSTQTETSLRQLVDILSDVSGDKIIPKYGPERAGDIYKSMLSNERAKIGLKWENKVALTEGLRRTYQHFVKQRGECSK